MSSPSVFEIPSLGPTLARDEPGGVCVCVCVFPVGGRVNVSQGIISIPPNASHHVGIPFKWNFCSFYIKPMDVSLAAFPVMSFLNVHVLRAHSPPSLDRIAPLGGSSLRLAARL